MGPNSKIKMSINNGLSCIRNLSVNKTIGRSNDVFKNVTVPLMKKIENSVEFVDNTLGVSEVSKAQEEVSIKEASFLSSRANVQALNFSLTDMQEELSKLRKKLDRTDRTSENYLGLVADEHQLLLEVSKVKKAHEVAEDLERRHFMEYSSAVRLSHEKERSRVERTKYWSIIGSVSGTIIGFFLSSIVTHYRLKSMKELTIASVQDSTDQIKVALNEKLIDMSHDAAPSSTNQHSGLSENDLLKLAEMVGSQSMETRDDKELLKVVSQSISQTKDITKQNKELLSMIKQLKEDLHSKFEKRTIVDEDTNNAEPVTFIEPVELVKPSKNDTVTTKDESSIDIPHTSILILATLAVCLYGFIGTS